MTGYPLIAGRQLRSRNNQKECRERNTFDSKAGDFLENVFTKNHYPNLEERKRIAKKFNVDHDKVSHWLNVLKLSFAEFE